MLVKQLITLSLSMDELLYRRRQHLVCGHGVSQAHSSHRNQRLIECVCSDARGEKTALITEKRLFVPRCRLLIRPFPRQPPDCLPGSERQGSDSTLLRGASHSTLRQSSTLLQHPATAPCYSTLLQGSTLLHGSSLFAHLDNWCSVKQDHTVPL